MKNILNNEFMENSFTKHGIQDCHDNIAPYGFYFSRSQDYKLPFWEQRPITFSVRVKPESAQQETCPSEQLHIECPDRHHQ